MARRQNEKRNPKQTRKSRKFRDSGCESDTSSSENEKHVCRHSDTQEFYRCHTVGQIVPYCPSAAPVESAVPTETATATMTTSIEYYWMSVIGRSPEKEGWYLDCAMTSDVCGDRRNFEQYRVYQARGEGNSQLSWNGRKQGHRIWRRAIEALVARILPRSRGCCEKRHPYRKSTQLTVTMAAGGSGVEDCACQWQWDQDLRQSTKTQCSRSRKSCGHGRPD